MTGNSITSASEPALPEPALREPSLLEPAARRLLRRAAALALACLAAIFLAEWLYRGLLFGPAALLDPLPYSPVSLGQAIGEAAAPGSVAALPPDIVGRYRGRVFSTDRLGFRNPPFALRKPPGVTRLAVIGYSIDLGAGVADDEAYPRRLAARLEAAAPGRYEVLNLSLPGPDQVRQAATYERVARPLGADLVLLPLYLGGDADYRAFDPKAAASFAGGLRQHFYVLQAQRALNDAMFDTLGLARWAPLAEAAAVRDALPQVPVDPRLVRRILRDGRRVVLIPLLRPRHNRVSPADLAMLRAYIEAFGADPCVAILRALPAQLGRIGRWDIIYPGDDHPDARVQAIYGEAVFDTLWPLLQDPPPQCSDKAP